MLLLLVLSCFVKILQWEPGSYFFFPLEHWAWTIRHFVNSHLSQTMAWFRPTWMGLHWCVSKQLGNSWHHQIGFQIELELPDRIQGKMLSYQWAVFSERWGHQTSSGLWASLQERRLELDPMHQQLRGGHIAVPENNWFNQIFILTDHYVHNLGQLCPIGQHALSWIQSARKGTSWA